MYVTAVGRGCVLVLVVVHDGGVVEVGLVGGLVLVVVHDGAVGVGVVHPRGGTSNLFCVEDPSESKAPKTELLWALSDDVLSYQFSPIGRSGRLSRAASAGGFYSRTPSGCPSKSNQI